MHASKIKVCRTIRGSLIKTLFPPRSRWTDTSEGYGHRAWDAVPATVRSGHVSPLRGSSRDMVQAIAKGSVRRGSYPKWAISATSPSRRSPLTENRFRRTHPLLGSAVDRPTHHCGNHLRRYRASGGVLLQTLQNHLAQYFEGSKLLCWQAFVAHRVSDESPRSWCAETFRSYVEAMATMAAPTPPAGGYWCRFNSRAFGREVKTFIGNSTFEKEEFP